MAIVGLPEMVVFFTSTNGYGWSETYRYFGSATGDLLTAGMNFLVNMRRAWLSLDAGITRIRMQSQYKRDPLIFTYNPVTTGAGQQGDTCNNSDNALLIRSEAPDIGFNRQLVRGIPDRLVTNNRFTPDSAWQTPFDAWKNFVKTSGYFGIEANVDNPQPPEQVTSMVQAFPRGFRITMTNDTSIIPGNRVRVAGASVFGYNGVKNIVASEAPVAPRILYAGGATPPADNPIADRVTVTQLIPRVGALTEYFVEQFTTRKAGRPFGQRLGRARTRLSLRPSIHVVAP